MTSKPTIIALAAALTACTTLPDGRVLTPEADAAAKAATLDVLACGSAVAIGEVLAALVPGAERPSAEDYQASGECYARRLAKRIDGLPEVATAGDREALGREVAAAIEVEERLGEVRAVTTEERASACEAKAAGRVSGEESEQ